MPTDFDNMNYASFPAGGNKKTIKELQNEAVREFAEKLKKNTHNYYPSIDSYCCSRHVVLVKDIDELLEEYTL